MRRRANTPDRDLPIGEVNIIPIVDVSFCLVIFCMVTMNIMLTAGINVLESRGGASTGKASLQENIAVQLTRENKIFVNSKEVRYDELFRELAISLPKTKDKMVILTCDNSNSCEQVVNVLDISKKSGAERLALVQNPDSTAAVQ
jgi:biopolymer transport protein ExbD